MNKDDFKDKLENLVLPEVEIPSHERMLKRALLDSGYWKGRHTRSLPKKAIPLGVVVVIGAIAAIIGLNMRGATPAASAQEIAQNSYEALTSLPPDEQIRLNQVMTLGRDARTAFEYEKTLLDEANSAKDLKVLTYAQVIGQNPSPLPRDDDGRFQDLKYLQFTGEDGRSVIIGVDANDTVAVIIKTIQGTRKPDGNCEMPGYSTPTIGPSTGGWWGYSSGSLDRSTCTEVMAEGPGSHPDAPPIDMSSGGSCSPRSISQALQSSKDASDLTVLTFDEFMAQPPAKDHPQVSLNSEDPAIDAKIHSGKYLQFTETDGSKVTIGVDENNLPFWWQSMSSNSGCEGGTGVNTLSRGGESSP